MTTEIQEADRLASLCNPVILCSDNRVKLVCVCYTCILFTLITLLMIYIQCTIIIVECYVHTLYFCIKK